MADLDVRRGYRRYSPLAAYAERLEAAGSDAAVRVAELPFLAMVELRLDPRDGDAAARAQEALGLPLPGDAGTWSGDAERGVLWMGPDWWLVVGAPGSEERTAERLRFALGVAAASVVDVSAQRTTLQLTGPRARDVLMTGCSVDLHPRSFPPGRCAQTLLAKAQVVVYRLGDGHGPGPAGSADAGVPAYRILVRASFARYLAAWLLDAMAEYTPAGRGGPDA